MSQMVAKLVAFIGLKANVPIHKEARFLVNVTAVVLGPKRGYLVET
jgi:hypothetical protein